MICRHQVIDLKLLGEFEGSSAGCFFFIKRLSVERLGGHHRGIKYLGDVLDQLVVGLVYLLLLHYYAQTNS